MIVFIIVVIILGVILTMVVTVVVEVGDLFRPVVGTALAASAIPTQIFLAETFATARQAARPEEAPSIEGVWLLLHCLNTHWRVPHRRQPLH